MEVRSGIGAGTVALIFASLLVACGDPQFYVWVANEDPVPYYISLRSADGEIDRHWVVQPNSEAVLWRGPGEWSAELWLHDAECRVLASQPIKSNVAEGVIVSDGLMTVQSREQLGERPVPSNDLEGRAGSVCGTGQ